MTSDHKYNNFNIIVLQTPGYYIKIKKTIKNILPKINLYLQNKLLNNLVNS